VASTISFAATNAYKLSVELRKYFSWPGSTSAGDLNFVLGNNKVCGSKNIVN
jgi:hypothetical protein